MMFSSTGGTTVTASTQLSVASSIRRKPNITYQSPSGHVPATLRIEESVLRVSGVEPASSKVTMGITVPPSTTISTPITAAATVVHKDTKTSTLSLTTGGKKRRGSLSKGTVPGVYYTHRKDGLLGKLKTRTAALAMATTALPLYHPLGKLALSLPELDAASLGLPVKTRAGDTNMRSSSRARRPAAKLREAEADEEEGKRVEGGGSVSAGTGPGPGEAPTGSREREKEKERAGGDRERERNGPRRKRGSGTASARRRRRELDDGDATYPAKRTRNTRGGAAAARAASAETEFMVPGEEGESGGAVSVPEGGEPGVAVAVAGRRSRRARVAVHHRESSGSEGSGTSVSVSIAAGNSKIKEASGPDIGKAEGGESTAKE